MVLSLCCPAFKVQTTASLRMTTSGWRFAGFCRHGVGVIGTVTQVRRHGAAWFGGTCVPWGGSPISLTAPERAAGRGSRQ
jgi:hypothetical protein